MTKERARELFAQRTLDGTIPDKAWAPGEREEIKAIWDKLPGASSFMDAFACVLYPDDASEADDTGYTWLKGRAQWFRKFLK